MIKVSELTGAQLDYWVARAEGREHPPQLREMSPGCCLMKVSQIDNDDGSISSKWVAYTPSTNWIIGGQIIEEQELNLSACTGLHEWSAFKNGLGSIQYGYTPLIAAMRCYVESIFGPEFTEEGGPPA